MPAASSRAAHATEGLLSIGQVLARLTPEFPALTTSKLRFLEVQGIVAPTRTASGYRKFSNADVERLRLALQLQRDHYLPLHVIRDYLADRDVDSDTPHPAQQPPPSIHPQGRRYSRDELLRAAGARPQLLNEAVSTGVLPAADSYPEQCVSLLSAIAALDKHGIEPRHIRALRQSAERDVALVEQALAPLLHRADAPSRARASETGPELARRLDEVRAHFVRAALGRLLP
ncbi:MerR family transcriptional regulator [Microbacterium sp. LRZ72]|uniref:transcriptional regulator FtsR n=1 Tax=Microbacterium sp. LRZ72 TaxID=2942481 RepID=UPI0029B7FEE8|nr:MerR family transcriptional regulator [Microbacterium sp. LRZ72]MDX2377149.1 MerR family transcriptional regulator [Microbacterium sp. LRZ72]